MSISEHTTPATEATPTQEGNYLTAEGLKAADSQDPTREDCLRSVEQIISMLRANPDLPLPYDWTGGTSRSVTIWATDKEMIARIVRAMGGGEKKYGSTWFSVEQKFGPVTLQVLSDRATVCRRIVTGYKEVPAREAYIAEEVEWVCEEPVLAAP